MTRVGSRRRDGADLLAALDQRIAEAATVLLTDPPAAGGRGTTAADLLPHLIELCSRPGATSARWLLLTAAFGAFPTVEQLKDFGRYLELAPPAIAASALLADVLHDPHRGRVDLHMTVVDGGTIVDVDFCARNDFHTGIHRVVRETVPRWSARHDLHAVAWIDEYSAFRALAPQEDARVFAYGRRTEIDAAAESAYRPRLIVPWRSVVVLTEVTEPRASGRLAALAQFSGNSLSMIGYDMIPITSAEMRPPSDAVTFAQYLTVVKHAHRLAGISRSAAAEFAGFASSVTAQGLAGPTVREIQLAGEAPRGTATPRTGGRPTRPVVLCLGSREPHKNQRAALHAAERLWREGLDFEVRLVGGPGWSDTVLRRAIDALVKARRPVTSLGRVTDARLIDEMRSARIVFFASLHEGYGLPVAEALATGTPVITSDFGSQAEIAELGGCLTVNPRDDDSITDALRVLLTDPDEVARLRAEAANRPVRSWDEYADELWDFLVASEDTS
jgi:glycosyltransferase involved in cell wall biosynthesis